MRLRLILVSLLLLPGFVLGPGWNLRICTAELLGGTSCCDVELVASCCSDDAPPDPAGAGWSRSGSCETCCLDIDTSREQLAPTKAAVAERELVQLVACGVAGQRVLASAARRTALAPRARPPAPPGGVVPLPLRI